MPKVPQTHTVAESTSNPKPPLPPPTDDQMERVRDLASQLYYGFKKWPPVGADGRGSWEARFMRKFHAMLKILLVAKFDQLPPFAIGCIWENNRRLHLEEPKFNPERVTSAKSPGHPAYRPYGQGRLRYSLAFKSSPMALKKETDIRDNWWTKSAPPGPRDDAPAPEAVEATLEAQAAGEVGAHVAGGHLHSAEKNPDGRTDAGATEEGESEVEGAETGVARGTRGRRGRVGKAVGPPPVAAPARTRKGRTKQLQRSGEHAESEMEINGQDSERGRHSGKGTSPQGTSQGTGARTRSASRIRAAAVAPVANTQAAPSSGSVMPKSKKAKGKQPASAKLTVYDLQPEAVVSEFIQHPRPCDRCQKLDIACIFNPLSRSYCEPCKHKKVRCSNAFRLVTDHCMATYLGYTYYCMVSDLSTYVEPTFTPTNLPDPLPTDIEWFRALYQEAKKGSKAKAKKAVAPSLAVTSSDDEEPQVHSPAPPAAGELPQDSSHQSGRSSPLTRRSRSVSQALSRASSTMPGSSTVSVEQPPPSPSAISETSHALPPEMAATSCSSPSYRETFRPLDAMSIDDEDGAGDDAAASNGASSYVGGEGNAPRLRTHKMRALTVRGSELEIPSTSRLELSVCLPPRGAARRTTSIHLVPRLQESWKVLPHLGPRTPHGHYAIVPPLQNEDWVMRWQELMNAGGSDTSEPWNAEHYLNSHVEPLSRPQRPPSRIFTVSDEVQRIVRATRELFDEIAAIKERMQIGARLYNRRSREVLHRRPSNAQQPVSGDDDSSAIHLEELSAIFIALGEVYSILTKFSTAFECVPAVPVHWEALSDLLMQIEQLQGLYKVSWERFASLEEDVHPLRAEMQRIRYAVADVQERLDGISNDAASACEPLIHNLYRQIDTRLSRLENGGGPSPPPLPPQLGDVLKMFTQLSERIEQLERAAESDDFHTRIDGYISRYLVDCGVHDDILWQLGTGQTGAVSSTSAGSSISHVFRAAHHLAAPSAVTFATSVPASPLSTTPPAARKSTHGAVSAPAGIRLREPPLHAVTIAANAAASSEASLAGGGSSTVPRVVAQSEGPAHIHTAGVGIGGSVGMPQQSTLHSVVSKMHLRSRAGTTSTRWRGT